MLLNATTAVVTAAPTLDELAANLQEAIALHVDRYLREGRNGDSGPNT